MSLNLSVAWRKRNSKGKLGRYHLNHCHYPGQGDSRFDFLQILLTINHTRWTEGELYQSRIRSSACSVQVYSHIVRRKEKPANKNWDKTPVGKHCHSTVQAFPTQYVCTALLGNFLFLPTETLYNMSSKMHCLWIFPEEMKSQRS